LAFRITQYGRREVALGSLLAWTTAAAAAWAALRLCWAFWAVAAVVAALGLWLVWFFRDPDRTPPAEAGVLLSPADGRVADVTPIGEEGPLGRPAVRVGIFMNVFNVHVNRSPAAAAVQRVEHRDGVFLDARDPHAAERNESTTVHLIRSVGGAEPPVIVRQIAGLIARRIVTDVVEGQRLAAGQRLGMIKFGSRVDLLVAS